MEKNKKRIISALNILSGAVTIIFSLLPNNFPYTYKVIIILVLLITYFIEAFIWKRLRKLQITHIILSSFLLLMAIIIYMFQPTILTSNVWVYKNCKELTLEGELITSSTIKSLNKLKKLTSLSFENCTFEKDAILYLDLPKPITNVSVLGCKGITDFNFLTHATNLQYLKIIDCGLTDDNFPNIQIRSLRSFCIDNNSGVSELRWLPPADLEMVSFSGTSISNVEKLAQYKSLISIVGNNTPVADLSFLSKLTNLREISFDNCQIEKVTAEFMSLRLETLSLSGNNLTDSSGFQNCTTLNSVDLSSNQLVNVSWLEKSWRSLESLYLSDNPLNSEDLSFLCNLKYLVHLGISGISFESLDFAIDMEALETLQANRCGIKDITALHNSIIGKDSSKVMNIQLGSNDIYDISPLTTIYPRTTYELLNLSGNPIDTQYLHKLDGTTIILDYYKELSRDFLYFSKIYIVDCPADQQVSIEDNFIRRDREIFFITQNDALLYLN